MNISINTICLFQGLSLPESFEIMQRHGYSTFELWMIKEEDVPAIADAMKTYGMKLSTCCTNFFTLNDPDCRSQYEAGLISAMRTVKALGGNTLITQVGQDNGRPRAEQRQSIVDGLRQMAPLLEREGVILLVEPLNDVKDHVGYYLTDSSEGADIVRAVDSKNVRMLYDIYHQVHMGEDVISRIRENLDIIAHFHVAGHPKRDADLITHFDYRPVVEFLNNSGVTSPIGLELFPGSLERAEALLEEIKPYI